MLLNRARKVTPPPRKTDVARVLSSEATFHIGYWQYFKDVITVMKPLSTLGIGNVLETSLRGSKFATEAIQQFVGWHYYANTKCWLQKSDLTPTHLRRGRRDSFPLSLGEGSATIYPPLRGGSKSVISGWVKRAAFTLAETLITLGIIGIVAAITMPIITSNIKRNIAKHQFKHTYSILMNAFEMTMLKNGATTCVTPHDSANNSACKAFWEDFVKELKVAKYCENNAFDNGCVPNYTEVDFPYTSGCGGFAHEQIKQKNPAALLSNGIIVFPYAWQGRDFYPAIGFDINGFKGPNQGGKDVFSLEIGLIGNSPTLGGWHNGYLSYCLPMAKGTYFRYLEDVLTK